MVVVDTKLILRISVAASRAQNAHIIHKTEKNRHYYYSYWIVRVFFRFHYCNYSMYYLIIMYVLYGTPMQSRMRKIYFFMTYNNKPRTSDCFSNNNFNNNRTFFFFLTICPPMKLLLFSLLLRGTRGKQKCKQTFSLVCFYCASTSRRPDKCKRPRWTRQRRGDRHSHHRKRRKTDTGCTAVAPNKAACP